MIPSAGMSFVQPEVPTDLWADCHSRRVHGQFSYLVVLLHGWASILWRANPTLIFSGCVDPSWTWVWPPVNLPGPGNSPCSAWLQSLFALTIKKKKKTGWNIGFLSMYFLVMEEVLEYSQALGNWQRLRAHAFCV
jgi:hypothetical protein